MESEDRSTLYPFEIFDPLKKRWRRTRWRATMADIEARGGRIVGPGWLPNPTGQFRLRDDDEPI
jgi:hypothetical protein